MHGLELRQTMDGMDGKSFRPKITRKQRDGLDQRSVAKLPPDDQGTYLDQREADMAGNVLTRIQEEFLDREEQGFTGDEVRDTIGDLTSKGSTPEDVQEILAYLCRQGSLVSHQRGGEEYYVLT